MKKVTLVLLTVCLCFGLCFSAYADDMYYQGDAKYPIAFVQWGKGYVLDLFSVQELEKNTLLVDAHIVSMETKQMSPETIFIAAKFKPFNQTFTIGFQKAHGLVDLSQARQFAASYMERGNSETGFLFSAGLLLWEALKGKPFFAGDRIRLLPPPMLGSPTDIRVDEVTTYSRLSRNRAVVYRKSPCGGDFLTVLFAPAYFILEEVHSQDEKTQAKLSAKCGQIQKYSSDPHIDLVRRYMGYTEP